MGRLARNGLNHFVPMFPFILSLSGVLQQLLLNIGKSSEMKRYEMSQRAPHSQSRYYEKESFKIYSNHFVIFQKSRSFYDGAFCKNSSFFISPEIFSGDIEKTLYIFAKSSIIKRPSRYILRHWKMFETISGLYFACRISWWKSNSD